MEEQSRTHTSKQSPGNPKEASRLRSSKEDEARRRVKGEKRRRRQCQRVEEGRDREGRGPRGCPRC